MPISTCLVGFLLIQTFFIPIKLEGAGRPQNNGLNLGTQVNVTGKILSRGLNIAYHIDPFSNSRVIWF